MNFKLFALGVATLCAAAPARAGVRLPTTVTPSRYAITFEPDLPASTFVGSESIDVRVQAPASEIVMHALDLEIAEAAVVVAGESWPLQVKIDPKQQTLTLTPADGRPVPAGPAQVRLEFRGKLNDKLHGFYAAESDGHKFAFTQFEATDARRAYPCFDEPAFKARFQITAVIDPADKALSNGAVVEEKLDKKRHKKVLKFAETLPMSSYLVALAVGPLVEVKGPVVKGKPPIRVWTPPGKEKLAGFALHEADALIDKLGSYFGIPYPYGKLDLVAVPDFAAGAMENTGAIFFRETALLVDEKTASAGHRHGVSATIAHEMAHQWFGDLVTMQWWDDLWLNEAFATWMEVKVVDMIHPDWHVWLDFEGGKARAMGTDSLQATHPIRTPVNSPEDANDQFDGITYSKGSSVLRMLETWLGEEKFRKGVGDYLRAHAHGNAVAADLWKSLGAASGQPVAEVAGTWLDQPGFPVVTVESTCVAGQEQVDLSQKRFVATGQPGNQKWMIPVCLRTSAGGECTLLSTEAARITLKAPGCGWVDANARRAGFYRVKYAAPALAELGRVALKELDAPERVGLVNDAWALVRRGETPIAGYLDVIAQLKGEPTPEVNNEVASNLQWLEQYMLDERDRPLFTDFVEQLFRPLFMKLGWEARPGESDNERSLRGTVLETLGLVARSKDVIEDAKARLAPYMTQPGRFDGTVGGVIVAINAQSGPEGVYNQFLNKLRASKEPEEHSRFLHALAGFEDPSLVQRTLELMLTKDVRVQDLGRLLAGMMHNKATRGPTWNYFKANYAALKAKAPPYGFERLAGATGGFCDEQARKDTLAFFSAPEHKLESQRSLKQAQEAIQLCTSLKTRESAGFSAWLKARAPKHASN
jgi:puromycin-sensitive aminopeptidase